MFRPIFLLFFFYRSSNWLLPKPIKKSTNIALSLLKSWIFSLEKNEEEGNKFRSKIMKDFVFCNKPILVIVAERELMNLKNESSFPYSVLDDKVSTYE